MWSLYENDKKLKPLIFSNGKSQEDIVKEVISSIEKGYKIIFIKGMCGTGKSAVALNLARKLGKTSIVVPIKSLQEQYTQDYSEKKYVLNGNKKLKICSIFGRKNFKCKFLQENPEQEIIEKLKETNAKLTEIFDKRDVKPINLDKDDSCDNMYLPCKIEIKEKNMGKLKQYIKQNPDVKTLDFSSISDVKRITVASICPYWCPIVPEEFEIKKFKDANKIYYEGLNNKNFIIYQRKKGCGYYDQYETYSDADVLIFNSLKYKLEVLMDRKPKTQIEIIDECDEFLDGFINEEKISLNRLSFALSLIFADSNSEKIINELIDIVNTIKQKYNQPSKEIFEIKDTLVEELLKKTLENKNILNEIEIDESSYLFHLDKVSRIFIDFLNEAFFTVEKKDNDLFLSIVTTNLEKRLKELTEKNNIMILMSGTIHSESILRNIFGINEFKIIEAEIQHQGELIPLKQGYEINCKYTNLQTTISRERYLLSFSKAIDSSKPPTLVHITSFSDLPTDLEKEEFNIINLPSQNELIQQQKSDPFGKKIRDFKNKKINVLFTTKCSRGIDFPGQTCNSIVISRFPYPNISSIFWKILKKTNPQNFMSFYMDKAKREILQKIYRGLRSKNDRVYLLSPDIRVLNFKLMS